MSKLITKNDLKAIFDEVLLRSNLRIETIIKEYNIPALAAGARGYWTITLDTPLPNEAHVISILPISEDAIELSALQLTPIYITGQTLYVEYHAPVKVTETDYSVTFQISYLVDRFPVSSLQADYVIETGTDGGWHYRKWNSGAYDAWQTVASNVAVSTASGSSYCSETQTITLPSFALIGASNYAINASINGVETIYFEGFSGSSLSVTYRIMRTTSRSASGRSITFTLMGKWK